MRAVAAKENGQDADDAHPDRELEIQEIPEAQERPQARESRSHEDMKD
jgi:hypothetical protein